MTVHLTDLDPTFPPEVLDDLRSRLLRTRRTARDDDWSRGTTSAWLDDVLTDWLSFDVAAFERRLAGVTHQRASVDGQQVHVVTAAGRGPDPLPLLLCNGWPSSFYEYVEVLPLLTDPGSHGGDPADAFTVVMPALPGFGFSAPPPPDGLGAVAVGNLWHTLMTEGLGHRRFAAHGSDLGARIVTQLSRHHPQSVAGIHLATPGLVLPEQPWTPAEMSYAAAVDEWAAEEGSYAHQQSTKLYTVSAALQDSPAGLAAWIGEKWVAWSSLDGRGEPAFGRELLLATLTLYWVTGTIATSMLPYWNSRHVPGSALPAGDPSPVPAAVTLFGGERIAFPKPPRELAERYVTVSQWREHDRGGHFPAAAEPALFVEDLREAFRPLRGLTSAG